MKNSSSILIRFSTSEAVVNYFKKEIEEGHLLPGEKLPSERVLQKQLQISRFSLREGLARLNALGIINTIHGKGAFVSSEINSTSLGNVLLPFLLNQKSRSYEDMFEARLLIEEKVSVLAAQRRLDEDLRELKQILEQAEIAIEDPIKFGVEFERSPLANRRGYPGGALYLDLNGEPFIKVSYGGYDAKPTSQRISAFVQDSWTIGDRLTINPGVRINHWRGYLPDPLGAVFKPKMGIAPRLGITFDVFGDHSTAFKAHYGKYYHGLMGMFYLHFQPQGTYAEYFWEDGEWVLDFEDPWVNKYTIDPDLKMAYMNQYVIGFERELMRDVSLGASFIYRTNHDFIDRVNITGMWEPVQWTDPYFGKTYTVYQRINPGENQFYVTNPKAGEDYGAAFPDIVGFTPSRNYRGLEFTFEKRYSAGWQLQGSYVYGYAWGSDDNTWGEYADNRTSSLGASTKYSNPNYQINAEGRLGFDPTHMLKIIGSFDVPVIDVSLGFYYSYMSGMTYNKNIMLPDEIDPDPVSWSDFVYIYADKKGSYRFPAQHNLDLRVEKFFKVGKYRLGVLCDLFNALNDDTEDDYETSLNPWSEYQFGYVWGIRSPRTFRAAVRFEF